MDNQEHTTISAAAKDKMPDKVIDWDVDKLVPNDQNPVIHPKKDVKKMGEILKLYDICRPPILIKSDGKIVDGHLRLMAAKRLGWTKLPTICCDDWTEEQIIAYGMTSRNSSGWADWDFRLLALEVDKLKKMDFSTDLLGFAQNEMDELKNFFKDDDKKSNGNGKGSDGDGDGSEPITKPQVIKNGDIFELDGHLIGCGDSTRLNDVEMLMDDQLANMIFMDPPYNIKSSRLVCNSLTPSKIQGHGDFKMGSGEMNTEQFTEFLRDIFKLNIKFSVDGSIHYICMDWRHMGEILAAGKLYTELKQLCVWVKDQGGMGAFYRSKHELVFVFKNGKAKHINTFELGQSGRYRTNVWEYAKSNSLGNAEVLRIRTDDGREVSKGNPDLEAHPTPKPVEMIADACLDCSNEGDIILDLCLGGGTTLIAAQQTGRICYGMDIEPKYVEASIRRYAKKFGKVKFKHLNGDLKLEDIID